MSARDGPNAPRVPSTLHSAERRQYDRTIHKYHDTLCCLTRAITIPLHTFAHALLGIRLGRVWAGEGRAAAEAATAAAAAAACGPRWARALFRPDRGPASARGPTSLPSSPAPSPLLLLYPPGAGAPNSHLLCSEPSGDTAAGCPLLHWGKPRVVSVPDLCPPWRIDTVGSTEKGTYGSPE